MQTITAIFNTVASSIRRDMRVRWGVGAGASVLLSAGVLSIGGSLTPSFLWASTTEVPLVAVERTPLVFPHAGEAQGLAVIDISTSTVAEVIHRLPKAERFDLLLYNSGAEADVSGGGQYTVFVPASGNFDYVPKRYIAGLSRTDMRQLALAHVVERALPLEESLNGTVITAEGTAQKFEVDASAGRASFGGADILKAYKASNGYVYIVNKVLLPQGN